MDAATALPTPSTPGRLLAAPATATERAPPTRTASPARIRSRSSSAGSTSSCPKGGPATDDTLGYTQIPYQSKIDHVMLSEGIVDRYTDRGQPDGCKVIAHDNTAPWASYTGGWNGEQVVSDHRPVWVYLAVE